MIGRILLSLCLCFGVSATGCERTPRHKPTPRVHRRPARAKPPARTRKHPSHEHAHGAHPHQRHEHHHHPHPHPHLDGPDEHHHPY